MNKLLPYLMAISLLINVLFLVYFVKDVREEREEQEYIISQYVDHLQTISAKFYDLSLELRYLKENNQNIYPDSGVYREILSVLMEIDGLFQINDELYLASIRKDIFDPSVRAINMEGWGMMDMIWNLFPKGEILKELDHMEEYNQLLKTFFSHLNENDFKNTNDPKEMLKILNQVSSELAPQH